MSCHRGTPAQILDLSPYDDLDDYYFDEYSLAFVELKDGKARQFNPNNKKETLATGNYSMVFDEGVQIFVGSKVYQTTFRYDQIVPQGDPIYSSDCTTSLLGWAHDITEEGHLILDPSLDQWNCFMMDRWDEPSEFEPYLEDSDGNRLDENHEIIGEESLGPIVNDVDSRDTSSQNAGDLVYEEDSENIKETSTLVEPSSEVMKFLDTPIDEIEDNEENLPLHWDWRNINGVNYVPEVQNQAMCGSCYIHSFLSQLESRIRIMTDNKQKPDLSVDYLLQCSPYTEGCNGGYELSLAKFVWEFGIPTSSCYGDREKPKPEKKGMSLEDSHCKDKCKDDVPYGVSQYEIIGGSYGQSSELKMMKEIRARGPISVAFDVSDDFFAYKEGVYMQNKESVEGVDYEIINPVLLRKKSQVSDETMEDHGDQWENVGHAISLVGWDEVFHSDGTSTKVWIAQNSWGDWAKENGFFYILRGENNANIESFAVAVRPRLPLSKAQVKYQ